MIIKEQLDIIRWNGSISIELIDQFICNVQENEYNLKDASSYNFCIKDMSNYYTASNNEIIFFIALLDDKIVGTRGLRNLGNNFGELRKFYIDYNFRHIGLGSDLFKLIIKSALRCNYVKIYAATMPNKFQAKKFYLNKGFMQIKEDKLPSSFKIQSLDKLFFELNLTEKYLRGSR